MFVTNQRVSQSKAYDYVNLSLRITCKGNLLHPSRRLIHKKEMIYNFADYRRLKKHNVIYFKTAVKDIFASKP